MLGRDVMAVPHHPVPDRTELVTYQGSLDSFVISWGSRRIPWDPPASIQCPDGTIHGFRVVETLLKDSTPGNNRWVPRKRHTIGPLLLLRTHTTRGSDISK